MKFSTSKAYKYVYKTPKYSNHTGLITSLVVHALILLLLLLRQGIYTETSSLSVTLLEEEVRRKKLEEKRETVKKEEEKRPGPEVRHKPNLFAAIQRTIEKPPPITNINIKQKIDIPKIEISKNLPIEPAPIVPLKNIEIKSVTEDIGPQARIDIKSLSFEETGIGVDIVVGQGVPTSEILKRPAYKPTVDISRQVAESGLGQGGLAPWGPGGGSGASGSQKVELKVKMEEPPPPPPTTLSSPSVTVRPETKKREKKIEVEISGSIAGRKIITKVLPFYPSWAAERGVEAVITVKIEVEPDGTVRKNVLVVGTSGYPNWDNIVKNSVLAWKFEALPGDNKTIQSGYITFRFILE